MTKLPAGVVALLLLGLSPVRAANLDLVRPEFLRDYAETRGFTLGRPTHAIPTPDGKKLLFLRAKARVPKMELFEFDVDTTTTRLLVAPEDLLKGAEEKLSPEEKALRERRRVSVGGFADFQLSKDGRQILLQLSGKLYVVQRTSGSVQELKTGAGSIIDPKFSPDGTKVAYVLDHDVRVFDLTRGVEAPVTAGGTEDLSHGLAEFVAREEMARFSGYWWAPDSRAIAFQETDNREVEVWYVADPAKPGDVPYPSRYPRPGRANAKVRLGVKRLEGGNPVWIDWARDRYPYLTTVTWDEHGPLTLAVQTRDQKELGLLKADQESGRTHLLLTERDPDWVNVRQDVPRWLSDDRGFIWAREQPGSGWQLEWRSPDGSIKRVLVPGHFGFRAVVDVTPRGDVIFSARPDPTQWKFYRANLDGSEFIELTPGEGCHAGRMDEAGTMIVDTLSTSGVMPHTTVYKPDRTKVAELPSVAEEPPFKPNVQLTTVGIDPKFYAAIVRPVNFERKQRYPVVVHVYGGPQPDWTAGTVVNSMPSWLLPQWIADQGFIVVSIDGRGTPGRGHDWERAIAKRFGSVPLADQVSAMKELGGRFPELDLERVGIYGWSFGGYMSALAVLKAPELFKAAVAGAPPTDWLDYDTHYTERYLGIPPADQAAYDEGSLLQLAPRLERPLLLVHGTGDDNVYFRHTLRLVDALFRAGKTCEVLPLSSLTHMVPDPVVNEQLYSRVVRLFKATLQHEPESARAAYK